jgi:hypothetical protein
MGEHAVGFQHLLSVPCRGFRPPAGHRPTRAAAATAARRRSSLATGSSLTGLVTTTRGSCSQTWPFGGAFLPGAAAEHHRCGVQRAHPVARAGEGAQFGHLGQHHGDDFQAVDLVFGILPRLLGLHHQHAQPFAHPLDGHAEEAGIHLLAGFGHVAKAAFGRGIAGVDRGWPCAPRGPPAPRPAATGSGAPIPGARPLVAQSSSVSASRNR